MREMDAQEFVRMFKIILAEQEASRFAFFLGAGCSLSSGIPTAGQIVKNDWLPKLKKIKTGSDTGVEEWAKKDLNTEGIVYDPNNAALCYGDIIEHLFLNPPARQAEIERLTLGRDPGYGYAVLAQLVSHKDYGECCNFLLTTNFDDMIADALYLYSNKKPLVIIHDSLVGFVKISTPRPVVIKLHGDARLAPRNTGDETKKLNEQVVGVIRNLLTERGIIFIGYGGNDKSITEILDGLPAEALPHGVWWVNNQIPVGPFGEWLEKRASIWVKHLDFDELMLLIWAEFNFDHPDNKRFEKIIGDYRKTFESLKKKIEEKPEEEKRKFERAIEDVVAKATDWWTIELEASKFLGSDPDRMETIYQEGLDKFPNSAPLLGNYAVFLTNIRKEYDRAEEFYKRAIEADPNHAINLGNYAGFLLAKGAKEEGFKILEKALSLRSEEDKILLIECLFYRFAHSGDKRARQQTLTELKKLLQAGVRSPEWNLDDNVQRAREDGHPDPEFLGDLADVITEKQDIKALDDFKAWKELN